MANAFTSGVNLNIPNNTTFKNVTTFPVGALQKIGGFSIPPKGTGAFGTNSAPAPDFSGAFNNTNSSSSLSEAAFSSSSSGPEATTRPYIWSKSS